MYQVNIKKIFQPSIGVEYKLQFIGFKKRLLDKTSFPFPFHLEQDSKTETVSLIVEECNCINMEAVISYMVFRQMIYTCKQMYYRKMITMEDFLAVDMYGKAKEWPSYFQERIETSIDEDITWILDEKEEASVTLNLDFWLTKKEYFEKTLGYLADILFGYEYGHAGPYSKMVLLVLRRKSGHFYVIPPTKIPTAFNIEFIKDNAEPIDSEDAEQELYGKMKQIQSQSPISTIVICNEMVSERMARRLCDLIENPEGVIYIDTFLYYLDSLEKDMLEVRYSIDGYDKFMGKLKGSDD